MKLLLTIVLLSVTGVAYAENEIDAKVEAALIDESRPAKDRVRDRNALRKSIQYHSRPTPRRRKDNRQELLRRARIELKTWMAMAPKHSA